MIKIISKIEEDIIRFTQMKAYARKNKRWFDASVLESQIGYAEVLLRHARAEWIESQAIEDTQGLIRKDLLEQ